MGALHAGPPPRSPSQAGRRQRVAGGAVFRRVVREQLRGVGGRPGMRRLRGASGRRGPGACRGGQLPRPGGRSRHQGVSAHERRRAPAWMDTLRHRPARAARGRMARLPALRPHVRHGLAGRRPLRLSFVRRLFPHVVRRAHRRHARRGQLRRMGRPRARDRPAGISRLCRQAGGAARQDRAGRGRAHGHGPHRRPARWPWASWSRSSSWDPWARW